MAVVHEFGVVGDSVCKCMYVVQLGLGGECGVCLSRLKGGGYY